MRNKQVIILKVLFSIFTLVLILLFFYNNKLVRDHEQYKSEVKDINDLLDSITSLNTRYKARYEIDQYMLVKMLNGQEFDTDSLNYLLSNPVLNDDIGYKFNRLSFDSLWDSNLNLAGNQINFLTHRLTQSEYKHRQLQTDFIHLSAERNQLSTKLNVQSDSLVYFIDSIKNFKYSIDDLSNRHKEELEVLELKRNGNSILYTGEKTNGNADGYGVGLWSTGGTYRGEWSANLRNGRGVYKWKDGELYDGEWIDDMRTGEGKYIWKDGHYYSGGWSQNKREGSGTIYYPNGKIQYQGLWKNDKFIQPSKEDRYIE